MEHKDNLEKEIFKVIKTKENIVRDAAEKKRCNNIWVKGKDYTFGNIK